MESAVENCKTSAETSAFWRLQLRLEDELSGVESNIQDQENPPPATWK